MVRLALVVVLVALVAGHGGCGGSDGPCRPGLDVVVYFAFLEGRSGYTFWDCDGTVMMEVRPALPQDFERRVIQHELGHARDLVHSTDTACVMYDLVLFGQDFCPGEAETALAFGPPSQVTVLDAGLLEATEAAIAAWNAAAGGTVFELVEGP